MLFLCPNLNTFLTSSNISYCLYITKLKVKSSIYLIFSSQCLSRGRKCLSNVSRISLGIIELLSPRYGVAVTNQRELSDLFLKI